MWSNVIRSQFLCPDTYVPPSSIMLYYLVWGDFPGGPVVKNPPSNAGDAGLVLGLGTKIPHAAGKLIPCCPVEIPRWKKESLRMVHILLGLCNFMNLT